MTAEIAPETRYEAEGQPRQAEVTCGACGKLFAPTGRWKQRFCSDKCRNTYHASMRPEALRRDIEELRRQIAEMRSTLYKVNQDADRRDGIEP